MVNTVYDVVIVGGGPIGASTAYFLSKEKNKKILLLTADPTEDHMSTYLYAGGSIRWYWDDPKKVEMTKLTADFITDLVSQGQDLSYISDNYLFLNRGVLVPSINVSGAKLVKYFLDEAEKSGVQVKYDSLVSSIVKTDDGYVVKLANEEYQSTKVLLAVGSQTPKFVPDLSLEFEKRQLFVLDVAVDDDRKHFPHLIFPFRGGVIFIFVKLINGEYKLVLGQEEILEHNSEWQEENYFKELLDMGLAEILPFIKDAHVEKILWGFDATHKIPRLDTKDNKFIAATCGSAVRSCVYIGQQASKLLTQ
jgi:glycine/D-amino acid oxidase-like deaminating enzyme